MIFWLQQEDGEGRFNSKFFRNDENEDELIVYANSGSPDFMECAEKCVDAFNSLSEPVINEICQKLINCAQEGNGLEEGLNCLLWIALLMYWAIAGLWHYMWIWKAKTMK